MRQSPVRGQKALDRPFLIAGCLAGATLAVYLRAIPQGFIHLDDPVYVNGNLHVLTGLSFQNLRWSFVGFHGGNWFPLTWLSLMLDAEVFGDGPAGFHFTNVALHVANTVLLFALLAQTTGSRGKSAFVAAVFALHPLHVESVAWISERKDVLSVFFGLLSLLAYVLYTKRQEWRILAASLLLFLCSLMSKQTLVTLPFLLLLLDYWPLERLAASEETTSGPHVRRLVLEKVPFLALSLVFCAIAVFAQRQTIGSLTSFPISLRCLNAVVVYVTYLRQAIFPYDLAAFYPYPRSIPLVTGIAAASVLLVVTAATLLWIRQLPFLFVGWAWYLGTLVPMVGIVQIGAQRMADRYTYFPLIGVFLAMTWFAAHVVRNSARGIRLFGVAGAVVLVLLSATTVAQIGYWGDSVDLYRRGLAFAPGNPDLMSWLGMALVDRGDKKEGLRLLDAARKIPPPNPKIQFAYALGLQKLGRIDEAAEQYRETLALDDTDAEAHSNLAVILSSRTQFADAKQQLLRAIQVDPDYVNAYINIGVVSMALGQYADAIAFSQRALAIDRSLLVCHSTIALALRAQGRFDEAISQYRYLVEAAPSDEQMRIELARTLEMKRQSSTP
jgi:tetratricopeptide (TPR) repeat protein